MLPSSDVAGRPLERYPGFGVEGVVAPGVGAGAVVVRPRPVEAVVDGVLQGELDIAPGPERGAPVLVERERRRPQPARGGLLPDARIPVPRLPGPDAHDPRARGLVDPERHPDRVGAALPVAL